MDELENLLFTILIKRLKRFTGKRFCGRIERDLTNRISWKFHLSRAFAGANLAPLCKDGAFV
jgi:hypothetical protein